MSTYGALAPPANPRPGPPLAISIVVLVAGFVIAVVGGIGAAVTFVRNTIDTPVITLPANLQRDLVAGTYDVYQWTGSSRGSFGLNVQESGPPGLGPSDITVTAPDGSDIPVGFPGDSLPTVTRGSHIFTPAARFHAPVTGTYLIRIRASGGLPEVVIGRSFGDALRTSAGWLVAVGIGVATGLTGLVLLLVGIIRRDRARPRAPLPAYGTTPGSSYVGPGPFIPPAGWYSDPGGSGGYRWWDGSRWTDHTR